MLFHIQSATRRLSLKEPAAGEHHCAPGEGSLIQVSSGKFSQWFQHRRSKTERQCQPPTSFPRMLLPTDTHSASWYGWEGRTWAWRDYQDQEEKWSSGSKCPKRKQWSLQNDYCGNESHRWGWKGLLFQTKYWWYEYLKRRRMEMVQQDLTHRHLSGMFLTLRYLKHSPSIKLKQEMQWKAQVHLKVFTIKKLNTTEFRWNDAPRRRPAGLSGSLVGGCPLGWHHPKLPFS